MNQFRIALAQLEPQLFDKEANLAKAERAIASAASAGAAAILFPELYLTGYALGQRAVDMAESRTGVSATRVAEAAHRHHIAVLMGFAELAPNAAAAYDSVLAVDPSGQIAGSYRKAHLFKAESDYFLPGDRPLMLDFGFGRVGVLICYDLEFPEAVRDLALRGAQWVATCTGNMKPNQHIQEIYVQSRAAENRLWVAVANRIGREADLDFFGGSAVADPAGRLTAQAGSDETVLFADIDLERAVDARQNADYLTDRRPELYRGLSNA